MKRIFLYFSLVNPGTYGKKKTKENGNLRLGTLALEHFDVQLMTQKHKPKKLSQGI